MTLPVRSFPAVVFALMLFGVASLAQTPERRPANLPAEGQEQLQNLPANANSMDIVANEIGQLRKSLQTLNLRLRDLSDKVLASGSDQSGSANAKTNRIAVNLEVLMRAEQRAEVLRKSLLELIEKETTLRSRLVQIEEDMRPESIERALNPMGSTRTVEIRDVRRRVLENERRGFESLLSQTSQIRIRLDDDVKQADSLVNRIRQRLLPLIEKEIEKINPN